MWISPNGLLSYKFNVFKPVQPLGTSLLVSQFLPNGLIFVIGENGLRSFCSSLERFIFCVFVCLKIINYL